MISRFIGAIHNLYPGASIEDVADALWLASQIGPSDPTEDILSGDRDAKSQEQIENTSEVLDSIATESSKHQSGATFRKGHDKAYLHSARTGSAIPAGLPFKVPAASALPGSLSIGRALRPFKRRIPSRTTYIIDELATAQQIAEEGLWIPVLNPAPTRWFEIALIVDASSSMVIWRQTIAELQRLLERQGAFRDVRTWMLVVDPKDARNIWISAGTDNASATQQFRSPRELVDPHGQRLFLVVTDCVSPIWQGNAIKQVLNAWGHDNPVTIVQVLPQRLWRRTALGKAIPVRVKVPFPGAPNKMLNVVSQKYLLDRLPSNGMCVPIVTLEPEPISVWAHGLMSVEGTNIPGFVFDMKVANQEQIVEVQQRENDVHPVLSAKQRVERFRATASPIARKLAVLVAAAPVSLPVIRLIQQTMLPEARQVHIAEFFLGGLLEEILSDEEPSHPDYVQYDFVEGVRELLLTSLPTNKSMDVLRQVSDFIETHLEQPLNFQALLFDPQSEAEFSIDERSRPFAAVATKVLWKLGGKYAALAAQLEGMLREYQKQPDGRQTHIDSTIARGKTSVYVTTSLFTHIVSKILEYHEQPLETTLVGQILARSGLTEPDFNVRLQDIIKKTLELYFETHPEYDLTGIDAFFEDAVVTQQIRDYILNRSPLNQNLIQQALNRHLMGDGIILMLIKQRNLVPENIVSDFLACYRKVLNMQLNTPQVLVLLEVLEQTDNIIADIKSSEVRLKDYINQLLETKLSPEVLQTTYRAGQQELADKFTVEMDEATLLEPNQTTPTIQARLQKVPSLFTNGLCKGRLLHMANNQYYVSLSWDSDAMIDWLLPIREVLTQIGYSDGPLLPYFRGYAGGDFVVGNRICHICEKLYTSRFSIFLLPPSQDRNVYLELGIAIGLDVPCILIRHDEASIPSIIEALNVFSKDQLLRMIPSQLSRFIEEYDFGMARFINNLPDAGSRPTYLIAAGERIEDVDFEQCVSDSIGNMYPHLEAVSLSKPFEIWQNGRFILDNLIETVQTSRFAIYQVDEMCSPTTFLSLGISIALNRPFLLACPKGKVIPLDIRGMAIFQFQTFRSLRREIIPAHQNFFEKYAGRDEEIIEEVSENHGIEEQIDGMSIDTRNVEQRDEGVHDGQQRLKDEKELTGSISNAWVGSTSPKSVEDLQAMHVDDVIFYLKVWEPLSDLMSPSREGLGRVLASVVELNPSEFAENAKQFQELDPQFVSALFTGLEKAAKQKKSFIWHSVLDLCYWVLGQRQVISEGEIIRDIGDPAWAWSRRTIAYFLSTGLEPDTTEIPFELRQKVWEVLQILTLDLEPTVEEEIGYGGSNMDPATLAVNTTRGMAMQAVIRYALWVRRHLEKWRAVKGFDEMAEVQNVLDWHLNSSNDPSLAVRSVYGQFFPWLLQLDPQWVSKNLAKIFPEEEILRDMRSAAWVSYITFCNPYDNVFDLLRLEYRRSIELIGAESRERQYLEKPEGRLAEHLMTLYWRGKLDLEDQEGLIARFLMKAPDQLRAHAIEFVGHSLRNSEELIPPRILERLKALWDWRMKAASGTVQSVSHINEFSAFGWWFSSKRFEETWAIAQLEWVLKQNGSIEALQLVVEYLSELSIGFPLSVLVCLDLLIQDNHETWWIAGLREHVHWILTNALNSQDMNGQQGAKDLINRLAANGYSEFLNLIPERQSIGDKVQETYEDIRRENSSSNTILPAILIGGPPHTGKSVLVYKLAAALRRRGIQHHAIRATPDGEGNWVQESDAETVSRIRIRGAWSDEFVERVCLDLKRRYLPLLVDIGGYPTESQARILRQCTHAILLLRADREDGNQRWLRLIQENGLLPLARIYSRLNGTSTLASQKPLIEGTITGLIRSHNVNTMDPLLDALVERIGALFGSFSSEELEKIIFNSAPTALVIDLPASLRTIAPSKQLWEPEMLKPFLSNLPINTPLSVHGVGPNWLYAALAAYTHPQPFYQFDPRLPYGWIQPPLVHIGTARSPEILVQTRAYQEINVLSIAIPSQHLEYLQQESFPFPPVDTDTGLIIDGKIPFWLLTALVGLYKEAGVPWIATYNVPYDKSVVVYSRGQYTELLEGYNLGDLISLPIP